MPLEHLIAEASTLPQISVLKGRTCKYTLFTCTPHCGASGVALGGLITWRKAAACGKAPVGAQGARSMAGILARRCPAGHLGHWASPVAGVGHSSSCHTNSCLLRHLPRNVTDAPHHPAISHLGSTVANPCPVAGG